MMSVFQQFLHFNFKQLIKIKQYWLWLRNFHGHALPVLFFTLLTTIWSGEIFATNFMIEYEFSETLKKQVRSHQIVWLETGLKRKTFALYLDTQDIDIQGGAIILPDFNQHPDWPEIIHTLRNELPGHGWKTLSIQPPIMENLPSAAELERHYKTVGSRAQAGISFFKEKGIENIVLIGRGLSANMLARFAAESSKTLRENEEITQGDVQALVLISTFDSPWLNVSDQIRQVPIAILDIFGENDEPEVIMSAKNRLIASQFAAKLKNKPKTLASSRKVQSLAINKTGNLRYRQATISGADHDFTRQNHELIKYIRGWLAIYAKGEEVENK